MDIGICEGDETAHKKKLCGATCVAFIKYGKKTKKVEIRRMALTMERCWSLFPVETAVECIGILAFEDLGDGKE